MSISIFKNFGVDCLRSSGIPDFGFELTPHLSLLALDALRYCGKMEIETDGKLKGFNLATDESLTVLSSKINDLANLALEDQTEFRWVGFEGKTKKADDCSVFELAFEGLFLTEHNDVAQYQISGLAALWLIDNAITLAKCEGISIKFIETLSEAALFLSQAASVHKDLYTTSAERNEALRKNDEFTNLQRTRSSQNATKRHENDPKTAEKKFIRECWNEWQSKPAQYKSNAEFARSMVEKCEHLTSHKAIENWCIGWKKESKNVTLLA